MEGEQGRKLARDTKKTTHCQPLFAKGGRFGSDECRIEAAKTFLFSRGRFFVGKRDRLVRVGLGEELRRAYGFETGENVKRVAIKLRPIVLSLISKIH